MNGLMLKGSKSATLHWPRSRSRQTNSTANGLTVFIPHHPDNCSSYLWLGSRASPRGIECVVAFLGDENPYVLTLN